MPWLKTNIARIAIRHGPYGEHLHIRKGKAYALAGSRMKQLNAAAVETGKQQRIEGGKQPAVKRKLATMQKLRQGSRSVIDKRALAYPADTAAFRRWEHKHMILKSGVFLKRQSNGRMTANAEGHDARIVVFHRKTRGIALIKQGVGDAERKAERLHAPAGVRFVKDKRDRMLTSVLHIKVRRAGKAVLWNGKGLACDGSTVILQCAADGKQNRRMLRP